MKATSIVLATDLSDASIEAARWAQAASERHNLAVTVMHVVSIRKANWSSGAHDVLGKPKIMEKSRAKLAAWYTDATGQPPADSQVLLGHIPVQIRAEARRLDAAILVMATSNKTRWTQFFLGSTAQSLAHSPPCPVVLVRPDAVASSALSAIAVGVDFSDNAHQALDFAAAQARAWGAKLALVHAGRSPKFMLGLEHLPAALIKTDYQKWAREQMNEFVAAHGVSLAGLEVETHLFKDDASHGLLEFITNNPVDLLVVGRTGKSRMGSDTVGDVLLKVLQSVPTTTCIVPGEASANK